MNIFNAKLLRGIHSLLVAASLTALSATAFGAQGKAAVAAGAEVQKVSFKNNNGTTIVGNLHFPKGFNKSNKYPVLVTVPPAGGAKEQTAGLYAAKMAERGFLAIAIDASFQGESGGLPRFKEDPNARVEDIRGAVDYLVRLPYVDENRIGVLGICAGGGYATSAAMTERRIRAVGLVVPVNGGTENRAGGKDATVASLTQLAMQRTAEARGGEPMVVPWIPDEYKDAEDIDLREAYQYYRTPRGQHPNWQNKFRFVSMDAVMAYDAFHLTEVMLTQPLQIIVGSKPGAFGSNRDGHEVFKRAASTQKDIQVFDGASHFDLYDNPIFMNRSINLLESFYQANLK